MGCKISCIEEYRLHKCTLDNTPKFSLDGQCKFMKVVDVYDADTITVAFDFHGTQYVHKLRLLGIDSAEIRPRKKNDDGTDNKYRMREKKIALKGRQRMKQLCLNKIVFVKCNGWDKYGRLLGTIYLKSYSDESLNELLVRENLAYTYSGKKKKEFNDWYKDINSM